MPVGHKFKQAVLKPASSGCFTRADGVLYVLTRAADKSVLWIAISAALATMGGRRSKRAAARGITSVALTSVLVNLPLKLIARRRRPHADTIPKHRRVIRRPTSYSFPSGHAASAAAFATGVALELPPLAVPVGAAAAAVAYSRVHFGVHYPGDVLAGAAVGAAVALAAGRLRAPEDAAQRLNGPVADPVPMDPLPDGRGIFIAVNPSSGPLLSTDPTPQLASDLPAADIVPLEEGGDLAKLLGRAAKKATAIGVAGGDGSIRTGAETAIRHSRPLVLVPSGTLNHLARDLRVESAADAVRAVKKGQGAAIDIGIIDGKLFCNTASLGAYVDLVELREQLEPKIGKWPAGAVALIKVLRRSRPLDLEINGRRVRVWMIFIGNCLYEPSGLAPARRRRLDDGLLDVRLFHAAQRWGKTRLVMAALRGSVPERHAYEELRTQALEVRSCSGPLKIACDGETFDASERFHVEKQHRALKVYLPGAPVL